MDSTSALLLCVLVTCSVWTVHGRSFKVTIDDEEPPSAEGPVQEQGFPGVCWACKWALNKIKKVIGSNTTAEKVTRRLKAVCDEIGLLKSKCHKFVSSHLEVLIEELTTTDDVRTICVNTGACKPKEAFDLLFASNKESLHRFQIDELPWNQLGR